MCTNQVLTLSELTGSILPSDTPMRSTPPHLAKTEG